jgi:diguanylate cyclase (GGDEF)-like protein/PAS domain S-box-containing protein
MSTPPRSRGENDPGGSAARSDGDEHDPDPAAVSRALWSKLTDAGVLAGHDIETGSAQLTELMTGLLRVERGSIWRFDPEGSRLECVDAFEVAQRRHTSGASLEAESAPAYFRALRESRCVVACDALGEPPTRELAESYLAPLGIGALLDAPIWALGRLVGVARHEHVGGARRWRFEEELIAGTMADFVARMLEASERLRAQRAIEQYRERVEQLNLVQRALRHTDHHLRILLGAAPVALALTRLSDARVLLANECFASLFQISLEQAIGRSDAEFYASTRDRERIVMALANAERVDTHLVRLKTGGGREFWAEISARIVELDGQRCSLMGIFDVTAQKELEEQLRDLATHDALTGASNRRHFIELVEKERERARRYARPLALCMLDVDHFKSVNDRHGHATGDRVLAAIARAAFGVLRTNDSLGRIGGEEFVILLPDTQLAGGIAVAERVRAAVTALRVGSEADGADAPEVIEVTVSIGVTEFRSGDSAESLLKRADRAMYQAKAAGRNRVEAQAV